MSLPSAVIEAERRADALIQAIQSGNAPTQAPAPVEAPAPAPVAAPAPAPQPGSTNQPTGSAPADDSDEHRYKVLQGKYNAEIPRLLDQVTRLTAQTQEQARLIEQLSAQLKSMPAAPTSLVTPEEVEEHGEGMVDLIRRAAREELATKDAAINELRLEIHQLRNGFVQTKQKGFLETLADAHPDWPVINDDQSFHRWLGQVDALSGRTRQDLLDEAQKAQDGTRAAAVFTAFKKDRDSWAATSSQALQNQLVPAPGAGGAGPQVQPGARVWTRAEVTDFYTKVRTGRLKGQEAAAIESEIQRAMAEGRIK